MSRRALVAAVAACAAGLSLLGAGCSSKQTDLSVAEGTPVTLGNLRYTVEVSRYLNPSDPEDQDYLQGAPSLAPEDNYLGVFLMIQNQSSGTAQSLPTRYVVTDTEHTSYTPTPLDNDFSLPLGGKVPAGRSVPNPESAAGTGPIGGSMLLFVIHQSSTENRPLTLKIPAADRGTPARIQLDI
jgi:hypothetical protein